jgi:hypothetical protein
MPNAHEVEDAIEEVVCFSCADVIPQDEAYQVHDNDYCEQCHSNETTECQGCNERFAPDDMTEVEDEYFCNECHDDKTCTCAHHNCDEQIIVLGAYSDQEGNLYCSDCDSEHLRPCHNCDNIYDISDMRIDGNNDRICNDCRRDDYSTCTSCDHIYHNSDLYTRNGDTYCESCDPGEYDSDGGNYEGVSSYDYKPAPNFYGSDNGLFMGVELEMDGAGCNGAHANTLMNLINEHPHSHMYIKADGSLDYGFEAVSHPATLDYHMRCMGWESMFEEAVRMGYRSHQKSTCGLHTHISRNYFGVGTEQQDVGIMKLLFLVERYWDKLLKFSRRTESQVSSWANRYGLLGTEQNDPERLLARVKADRARYRAINLIATLQFVKALCVASKELGIQEVVDLTWEQFVERCTGYPELMDYFTKRGIGGVTDIITLDGTEM